VTTFGRRQLLVIASAAAMVLIGAGIVAALAAATQTDGGREWIRARVAGLVNQGLRGQFYVGRLSGSFLTDLTIDSIALRDRDDSVFVSSGRLTLQYDPRDLVDGRFVFRRVEAEHPLLVIRRELDDVWNFRKIWPPGPASRPAPRLARGAFGALIVFHNVRVRDGEVQLTKPWHPDDSLAGVRRDSSIAAALTDPTRDVRRVSLRGRRGFQRTWRWTAIQAELTRFRFRHPDSTGRQFDVARVDVRETDPPFDVRAVRGVALWRGDTVWMRVPHFALPGSTGALDGKVEWPTGDTFWDVRVQSDSVALEDIHWIHPTLPRSGHGSMRLHVKSRANPDVIDYVITGMDARSEGSRLRGTMTYGVGGPVLEVRDVNLSLEPANFVLFETLNGAPFPYPWKGNVTGTVQASGGPVNRFVVERADLAFEDHNVPGATARGVGHGELDILFPGFAKFHGFQVNVDHFDLRTGQFLNPDFPRLGGFVSGTATLDSIWTDVRVRDADLVHRDGDDTPPTRLRGAARVTLGDDFVALDATAAALPLSAGTLAKSYPMLPLRGEYSGTIRAVGTVADLAFTTDLVGDAGRVQVDGRFDVFPPGFGAVARGAVGGFDLRRGLARSAAPVTSLDGRFAANLSGDSLANLAGSVRVDVDRSVVDSVRVFGGRASLRFADGRLHVDTAALESTAGQFTARGALGIVPAATDTLSFRFSADSLGGLRRYLARQADRATDSLAGTVRASGVLSGRTSRFALDATVEGSGLLVRNTSARQVRGTVALSALPDSATGAVTLRFDALRAGTVLFTDVGLRADLLGGWQARAGALLLAPTGVEVRSQADVRRRGDTTLIRLDSLVAATSANAWTLRRPATIALARRGFRLDSLALAGTRGGRVEMIGRTQSFDTLAATLRAEAVPLADVGELIQSRDGMEGVATLRADVRGTTARPELFFSGNLTQARAGAFRFERLDADGRYADRRLTVSMALAHGGVPALHADATLPVDLALEPTGSRFPEDPLTARIRTDSAGLEVLETFVPAVREARGTLRMDVDVGGTWRHPRATGSLAIAGGSLNLRPMGLARIEGLDADIGFLGDSVAIRRFTARSGGDRTSAATLSGALSLRDATDAGFNDLRLSLQRFTVLSDPRVAELDLTGNLSLTGRRGAAVLQGGFTVDHGQFRLPELYQKRLISLDDPNLFRVVDTSALVNRRVLTAGDTVFMNNLSVQNVTIRMGPDVWLRSEEANINLGGFVSVTRGRVQRGPLAGRTQLVLEGPLQTVRGTYRLNLGPVQRTFTVESGEVRFYGDPDLNAALNINAGYVVRQVAQQGARPDVRVRVRIGGTRLSPTLELSTPDSARVTTADLVSYLTTGGPSNEISGRGADYTSPAARALLTSFGSYLGGKVSGGLCDDAQIATTQLDAYQGRLRSVGSRILQGTRFNCAKQVSDRLFVRLDAGLCQVVDPGTASSRGAFADAFGAKLDYRLASEYTLSIGVEPPTSAVYCRDDAGARGFAPTPRQVGFDLFRLWRF
jgi:translocation and assembly module TamB